MYQESATPERTLAQRMEALAKANKTRECRADWKRDMKAGRLKASTLIFAAGHAPEYENDEFLATWKLYDVLVAIPKCGRVKANRILTQCRISPSKTLAGLTDRQREELLEKLDEAGL